MKLNNKGFAISSIMYIILVLAVVLIFLTLATLSSRKLILDKLKTEVYNDLYDRPEVSYRKVLSTLKEEVISYANENSVEKDSLKIEDIESSIKKDTLEKYKLSNKYLTMVNNSSTYDVYLGKSNTIINTNEISKNTIDIVDYKIYGNTYQETSVQGKNLFSISNRTLGELTSEVYNTEIREFEFDKYYVGFSMDNYYYPPKIDSYSTSNETITIKTGMDGASGYGMAIPIKVKPNTTYTLSKEQGEGFGIGFYTALGEHISFAYEYEIDGVETFTTPDNCEILTVILRPEMGIEITYKNIQLEEGTVATTYEKFIPNKPSIEYPSEMVSVGDLIVDESDSNYGKYKIPVRVGGKNLFNVSNRTLGDLPGHENTNIREFEFDKYYVGLTMNNYYAPWIVESYSLTGENITIKTEDKEHSPGYGIGIPIKVKPNTKYSISKALGNDIGVGFYTSFGEYISCTMIEDNSPSFTTPENCEILTVILRPKRAIETTYSNIQLEEGASVTDYEPYVETVTTNIYLDEPLSKILSSEDYIDTQNSSNVVRNINTVKYKGEEVITDYNEEIFITISVLIGISSQDNTMMSNLAIPIRSDNLGWRNNSVNRFQFKKNWIGATTVDELKNKLRTLDSQGTPLTINYILRDPKLETYELSHLNISQGSTRIYFDTELQPSKFEFTVIEKIIKI